MRPLTARTNVDVQSAMVDGQIGPKRAGILRVGVGVTHDELESGGTTFGREKKDVPGASDDI